MAALLGVGITGVERLTAWVAGLVCVSMPAARGCKARSSGLAAADQFWNLHADPVLYDTKINATQHSYPPEQRRRESLIMSYVDDGRLEGAERHRGTGSPTVLSSPFHSVAEFRGPGGFLPLSLNGTGVLCLSAATLPQKSICAHHSRLAWWPVIQSSSLRSRLWAEELLSLH